MNKKYKNMLLVALLALAVPGASFAAYLKADRSVALDQQAAIAQNAYVAGAQVTVSTPIDGDLAVAGGTVHISSQVSQDILAAGGTVILSGSAQDARLVGGTLLINGAYSGEMMAAGGQVDIGQGTTIVKDSYIAGGSVGFSGTEQGNLTLAGGAVYVNGTVHGNLIVHARQSVQFGANAKIDGTTEYTSSQAAVVDSGAKLAGSVTYHPVPVRQMGSREAGISPEIALKLAGIVSFAMVFAWFTKLLIVLAAAYVLWYGLRAEAGDMVKHTVMQFGKSLLTGFVVLVALPIAALLVCITIVGAIPGIVGFLVYGVLLLVAIPLSAIVTSSLLFKRRNDLKWYHLALGTLVIMLVKLVPFIGWVAWLAIYCASLGALSQVLWQHWVKKARA